MPSKTHIFCDMDGTICKSRQVISKETKEVLSKLPQFAVISGASRQQMEKQLDGLPCLILAQSGNDTDLWQNTLTEKEKKEILEHIDKVKQWAEPYDDKVVLLEDRNCQISYSFRGMDAPADYKARFDPDKKLRQFILQEYPFNSETLKCLIGGTTCFDYIRKDGDKGHNIERYIKEKGLIKEDCIYYGDALFPGGNDESVVGIIKCVEVKDPEDLMEKLNKML